MRHATPATVRASLLTAALLVAGHGAGVPAQTDAGTGATPLAGGELAPGGGPLNRFNQTPTIRIELTRDSGNTPFEVEATVTVDDPEEDQLRCVIRFDFDGDQSIAQRIPATFPDGTPQITVRRHVFGDGDGVKHVRVHCRDFDNRNGIARADAYVVLNPCDGRGFNACGTCGELPDQPCAPGDTECIARTASACQAVCGDEAVTGSEVCDGAIVPDENCGTLGLGRGALRCTSDCQGFVASGCTQAPPCPAVLPAPAPTIAIPDPPDHVAAAGEGCRRVRVAWSYDRTNHSTTSSVPGLSGFRVYRDGIPIAETTGRETCRRKVGERAYVDESVEAGATYGYEIAALNNLGQESERVGLATVTVPDANAEACADTVPPPAPANLRRSDPGDQCRGTLVAVDGVTDVGTGVRGYRYYIDGVEECVEVSADHVSGGRRLQYSRGLHPGSRYTLQVTAIDHAGNESLPTEPLELEIARCEQPVAYRTAVILVTYPDMPPPPMTPEEVYETVFGPRDSLRAYYEENSQSMVTVLPATGGGVTDWLELPHERLHYCDVLQQHVENGVAAVCDFEALRRDARELVGDSIDFDAIDRAIYAFYGSGGANSAVVMPFGETGMPMATLIHETAHAWAGRVHARGLTCPPGHQVPPDPADADLGCVLSEYGDGFDPMGSGLGHFSAHNKIEMGLLSEDALGLARLSGFYPVEQLALRDDGRKEIRLPLGDDPFKDLAYSFEYRGPVGWDAAMGVEGVVVRIVGPDLQHNLRTQDGDGRTRQLILNPGDGPFVDPYRGIQVRVHRKTDERAILHVCRD